MRLLISFVLSVFVVCSQAATAPAASQDEKFAASVRALSQELSIPGVAFAVVREGKVISKGELNASPDTPPFTLETPLRFASVTKAVTAVVLMRAVDRGALSLDDSVAKWLPEFADRPQITVRQLAAHVSEGAPGTEYVYATQRYAKLALILEKAMKASFEESLRKELISPLRMGWHDSPDLGAHAGLVSTVKDMAVFVQALQRNTLLSQSRFDEMTTPYKLGVGLAPVGVGIFSQQIGDARVVWSFGQDDPDHSSALLLMLPKRRLALVMLANTDELSNPFRLLMGDVRYSPFATAFLDAYAPEVAKGITDRERAVQSGLVALWNQDQEQATQQFRRFKTMGAPRPDDLVPHFFATMVGDPESREFMESLDRTVTGAHPGNRWVMLMSGGLNERLGHPDAAAARYKTLLALPNQEQDGLAKLFQAWSYGGLARVTRESDRQLALKYVDQGLATGVTGGTRDDLMTLRKSLE